MESPSYATDLRERLAGAVGARYAVGEELGRGGMAVVYRAEDVRHQRSVALKVILPEVAGTLGAERFLREIQVAANLTHPHVVPLYDSGEAAGLLYYVMPYVEGETLGKRLEREGRLSVEEAVRTGCEVADALSYAHRQGLVHRDIKPANILLSNGHALVADFGIARAVDQAGGDGLTRTGLMLGTPRYMSPEQWTDPEGVDGRSDVYALGCVLYEMLVGEPPYTGPTAPALLMRHVGEEVPSLREARPELPAALDAVVARALAKDPGERFQTADELADALRDAAAGVGPARTPAGRAGRPRRFRVVAAVMGVLVVAVAVAALVQLLGRDPGPAAADRSRLVVLPFANDAPEREYFADGMTEEVTSRLSSLSGIAVIARTSAMKYKGTDKSIREIGDELDVGYVIEGSVRCQCLPGERLEADDTVRISARLIDAENETQRWADSYEITLSSLFSVQAQIATAVADILELRLVEPERERLVAEPSSDMEAYDYYLQGKSYYNRSWERQDVLTALEMYERATELDPGFAPAFAQLSRTHSWIYRLGYDTSESRLEAAEAAVERALALDPELAEAHLALGLYHYWGRWDYEAAIRAFSTARRIKPGDAVIHRNFGNVRRRMGQWEEAIANYQQAAELDPRSHIVWFNLGDTHAFLRQYDEAERAFDRVMLLAPELLEVHIERSYLALNRDGDVDQAQRIMARARDRVPPDQWRPLPGFWVTGPARVIYPPDSPIRDELRPGAFGLDSATYTYLQAGELEFRNETDRAREAYRALVDKLEPDLAGSPGRWELAQLAVAYAALGRDQEALDVSSRAVAETAHDKYDGTDLILNHARVSMMVGDAEAALDQLELVLGIPSRLSPPLLRLDPVWDPLRGHPRFRALTAEQGLRAASRPEDSAPSDVAVLGERLPVLR